MVFSLPLLHLAFLRKCKPLRAGKKSLHFLCIPPCTYHTSLTKIQWSPNVHALLPFVLHLYSLLQVFGLRPRNWWRTHVQRQVISAQHSAHAEEDVLWGIKGRSPSSLSPPRQQYSRLCTAEKDERRVIMYLYKAGFPGSSLIYHQ